jgi:hypothetical protein
MSQSATSHSRPPTIFTDPVMTLATVFGAQPFMS